MLVTFTTKAWADITMFGDIAVLLIKMMGHSGTVPGALIAEDVPVALARLKEAVSQEPDDEPAGYDDDDSGERKVSIPIRAYPLIELLTAAAAQKCSVMWHD
jgi:hypothetical protein